MSTHYLIDTHVSPFSAAGNPRILDVIEAQTGTSQAVGGLIVRVPDYLSIEPPTGVFDPTTGLLAQKYAGLLGYYAGFPYITYDDLTDVSGVNPAHAGTSAYLGERGGVSLPPGGSLYSTVVTLSGSAPPQVVVTWEAYTLTTTLLGGQSTGRFTRTYTEVSASSLTCTVSFDNEAHTYAANEGNVLNVPLIGQGTSFVIRFDNPTADRIWLGGWAVIY